MSNPCLTLPSSSPMPRFHVTFVTSDYALHGILKSLNLEDFLARFLGFQFHSLPQGPAPFSHNEQPGSVVASLIEIFSTPRILARKQLFREVMVALGNKAVPPTCIIADGIMSFAIDVAEELGIPSITFRTYSDSCTWVYFHIHKLVQLGEIPFPETTLYSYTLISSYLYNNGYCKLRYHHPKKLCPETSTDSPSSNRVRQQMTMLTTFYWGKNTEVLFSGWPGHNSIMYALALIFVFLLAALSECLSNRNLNKWESGVFRTILHALRTGLSYVNMLAVMSCNGGIFLSVVAGHSFGFLAFRSRVFRNSDSESPAARK